MGRMDYDWGQTDKDVYIDFRIGEGIRKKDAQIEGHGRDFTCQLKDGRNWTLKLWDEVDATPPRVTLKDGTLRIQYQKKVKLKHWSQLQDCGQQRREGPLASAQEKRRDGGAATSTEDDTKSNERAGVGDETEGSGDGMKAEEPIEEERLVDQIKNEYFSRQDQEVLYLHMYVKTIKEQSVKVTFKEDEISIRFKTNDNKFLHLHVNSTNDTLFCWKIKPWKPIDPNGCSHKVTNSNLEVILKKQKAENWKALERSALATNSSQPGATSGVRPVAASRNDWVSCSTSHPTTPEESSEITKDAGSEKETLKGAVGGAKAVEIKENSVRTKKPTCTVPPLTLNNQNQPPPIVPMPVPSSTSSSTPYQGLCGLDNLGNTCFMNSVLQVLANTRELKDFMLETNLQNKINRDNPLGTGGHLVLSFAVLMRLLWSGKSRSIAPSKLKSIISGRASQFMGFAQHDAQEFMAFLLDGLHEDINRIRKKPYTETIDSDGRPDEVVAEEAWKMHRRRNDSFIVDLFQGQYKSKLVCPECHKVSITFDPFMQLSVPLPKKKRRLPIYFFSRDCHLQPVKYVVSLSSNATVHELTVKVAQKAGVKAANLRVFEVFHSRVHKTFSRRSLLSGVSCNDIIYVCEVLSPSMAGETVVELSVIQRMLMPPALTHCSYCKRSCEKGHSLKRCTKCYRAAYCHQNCQKSNWAEHKQVCRRVPEPVGNPFMISLPRSKVTYARLCQIMENYARYSTNMFQPPMKPPASPLNSAHSTTESSAPSSTSTHSSSSSEAPPHEPAHGSSGETALPPDGDAAAVKTAEESQTSPQGKSSRAMERQGGGNGGDANAATTPGNADCSTGKVGPLDGDGDEGGAGQMMGREDTERGDGSESGEQAGGDKGEEAPGSEPGEACPGGGTTAHTATVVGQPQTQERKMPLFFIKPVSNMGKSLQDKDRITDEGDNPLDLTGITNVAMDWRNDPKQENYVLIESKKLDCVEDESVAAGLYEDGKITLDQCLKIFTEPEKLSPEEAWYCPKCKQHREATKQMMLWRLPSTLIIQLKRFSFGNMLWRDKIDKMVEYPVRGLDLSPFCHCSHSSPLVYDLYGVINHHGGILGGHYTSFGRLVSQEDWSKSEHGWRVFDDSHVSPISEKNVVTRSAYLLFYRRRQAYVPYVAQGPVEPEPEDEDDNPEAMDDRLSSSSSEMEVVGGDAPGETNAEDSGSATEPSPSQLPPDNRFAPAPARPGRDGNTETEAGIGYTDMEDID